MKKESKRYFNIKIDAKSALPVYEQIKQAIKLAILSGYLEEGDRLMSIREMAVKLQINPNTILKVYYQLENEDFINSRPGSGYFVKIDRKKIQKERAELFEKLTGEYFSKAFLLGYSLEEMVNEISRKAKENTKIEILKEKIDVRN